MFLLCYHPLNSAFVSSQAPGAAASVQSLASQHHNFINTAVNLGCTSNNLNLVQQYQQRKQQQQRAQQNSFLLLNNRNAFL